MNTFFLKGRNLTLQTSFVRDGQDKVGISDKFLCAFEVIAFNTTLDYEVTYIGKNNEVTKYINSLLRLHSKKNSFCEKKYF